MIRGQVETREAKEDQMQERAGMLQTFTGASRTNLGTYQRRPLNSENEQKTKKEQRLDCRVEEVRRKGDTSEGNVLEYLGMDFWLNLIAKLETKSACLIAMLLFLCFF